MNKVVIGLDVGTNKVVALIGIVKQDGQVDIVGVGSCRSLGLRRGAVINIEATTQSIKTAIHEAELMAGVGVTEVYTGVSGNHIRSCNSRGIVAIKDREVTQSDLERVMDTAQALTIPADHQVIHIIPQEFILDGQGGVREPIGMAGVRLEVSAHIVTGSISAIQNIVKSIERCNIKVKDVILQPLASSVAVLSDDERELGCVLVDIGGGTTDIAIFTGGTIQYSSVIPIAGDQATNDVSIAFRMPARSAEQLKLNYANLNPENEQDETIEINLGEHNSQSGRKVSSRRLTEVLTARYQELFALVNNEIRRSGLLTHLNAGVILTGGGSKIAGVVPLAEEIFDLPVRVGVPQNIGGLVEVVSNPVYATGVGLLLVAAQRMQQQTQGQRQELAGDLGSEFDEMSGEDEDVSLWRKIKNWIKNNF